ncbi:MAG TPA: CPBP family intramembrane glutamic endopeptidase [bacterium]|nr:CPBP family intramembrane glutamic endopeptidase [bacterium]
MAIVGGALVHRRGGHERQESQHPLGFGLASLVWVGFYGSLIFSAAIVTLFIAADNFLFGGDFERFKLLEGSLGPAPALALSYVVAAVVVTLLLKAAFGVPRSMMAVRQIFGSTGTLRANLVAIVLGLAIAFSSLRLIVLLGPPPATRIPLHLPIPIVLMDSGWRRAMWALSGVVLAAPVEELVFRGVMLDGFTRSLGPLAGGLLVTLLFIAGHSAATHLWWPGIAGVAAVATVTLLFRLVTRSLGPPIALHAAYNLGIAVWVYTAPWRLAR